MTDMGDGTDADDWTQVSDFSSSPSQLCKSFP